MKHVWAKMATPRQWNKFKKTFLFPKNTQLSSETKKSKISATQCV